MISDVMLRDPQYWIIPWILQSIGYFFVLRRMGLRKGMAAVPFLAERELSTVLFPKMRSFYRPFVIAVIFMAGAYYLGPDEGTGYLYMSVATLVYGIFLIKLYHRLSKSFGKGWGYTLLLLIFAPLFLVLLGTGKAEYTQPVFKEEKNLGAFFNGMRKVTFILLSAVEVIVLVCGVGYFTVRELPPRPLVNSMLADIHSNTKDIVADGDVVRRQDSMGDAYADLDKLEPSRDKYFPDHSNDESVVVMEYIVGSNLENRAGLASVNIEMMKDATKRGNGLTFVLQTGGAERWFTKGIDDSSYGRYTVKGGSLDKQMDLDSTMTMEESANLEDFIKWTAENYPADRYMLVLWDHGGGVPFGYGVDDLQHRTDDDSYTGMRVSEVTKALKGAGVKFDMVGFDACLMQEIEIACAMEPYADYYLASEETEGGCGWFYTAAFGLLAADPGMDSEHFGETIVSSYDQFNTILEEGKPNTSATLSFVDLTRVKPAYEKTLKVFAKAKKAIEKDESDFAELGLAANNTYAFVEDLQIDLIDFLEKLADTDIDESICSDKEKIAAANALKACVVCRNKNSAKGANGMAIAFPYNFIRAYEATEKELTNLDLSDQRALFNDVFSIIAYEMKKDYESKKDEGTRIEKLMRDLDYIDYTTEEWYVKGFEDYAPTTTMLDIPLNDTGSGWQIELPEKVWNVISDCRTAVYQKTEDGKLRYLGSDHIGDNDENGHPMVDMDDRWVTINGQLVCYEDQPVKETESGDVFNGKIKARLNSEEDIYVYVEWYPVEEGSDAPETGYVTGYEFADDTFAFMEKGMQSFKSGDRIEFLFEYYDEEGKLIAEEPYGGSIIVSTMDRLKVEDSPLEDGDIEFLGVLTDVYQRDYMTETIEAHIGE